MAVPSQFTVSTVRMSGVCWYHLLGFFSFALSLTRDAEYENLLLHVKGGLFFPRIDNHQRPFQFSGRSDVLEHRYDLPKRLAIIALHYSPSGSCSAQAFTGVLLLV